MWSEYWKEAPCVQWKQWCLFRITLGAWCCLHPWSACWRGRAPHCREWWRVVKTKGQWWPSLQNPYQRGQLYRDWTLDTLSLWGQNKKFRGVRIRYIQSNNRIRAKAGGSNKKFFVFFFPTDLSWFLDWPFRRQVVWLNKPVCWSLGVYFCPQNYQLVDIIQFLGRIMLL